MIEPAQSWPIGVVAWLQCLVRQRLHPDLLLTHDRPGNFDLHLPAGHQRITIATDRHVFDRAGSDQPMSWWDAETEGWPSALGGPLPAPGATVVPRPLIKPDTSDGYQVDYDIFGLTYWALSRREEVDATSHDRHGRFPVTSAHAMRHGYLDRPVVDEWFLLLRHLLQRLWPGLKLTPLTPTIHVSHDIDQPSRYAFRTPSGLSRAIGGDLFIRWRWLDACRAPWIWMHSRERLHPIDPYNTFDWLMEQSEAVGLRSTFFVKAGQTDPAYDNPYTLDHPAISDLLCRIHSRGHRIGLHPSYHTWRDPAALCHEATLLRNHCAALGIHQDITDCRMHYLRWDHPVTMRHITAAGFACDGTLGYGMISGFRCATCHSFQAIDPVTKQTMPLRIQPLIFMDAAETKKALTTTTAVEQALNRITALFDRCKIVGGSVSVLWHNSELWRPVWRQLYTSLVVIAMSRTTTTGCTLKTSANRKSG